MSLWTVLLFIVDKSGWCYCGLCCCLLWISLAGVIVDCVVVYSGSDRLLSLRVVRLDLCCSLVSSQSQLTS